MGFEEEGDVCEHLQRDLLAHIEVKGYVVDGVYSHNDGREFPAAVGTQDRFLQRICNEAFGEIVVAVVAGVGTRS